MKNIILGLVIVLSSSVFAAKEENDGLLLKSKKFNSNIELNNQLALDLTSMDVQYNCRRFEVTHKRVRGPYMGWGECVVTYTCYPRTLQQKQILSLQRACEKDPKPECFDKDFLDYIGSLKNSEIKHINKSTCSNLWAD